MFISCTLGGKEDLCLTLHTELETSLLKRLVNNSLAQEPGNKATRVAVDILYTKNQGYIYITWHLYPPLCTSVHTHYSIDCYTFAQAMLPSPAPPPSPSPPPIITGHQQRVLCDKLGNAWNELGVYYMRVANSLDFANGESRVSPPVI